MDLSIIIAHRGDVLGLWATLTSCETDLHGSGIDYEYRICTNGFDYKSDVEIEHTLHGLNVAKKLGLHIHNDEVLSPPSARMKAANGATGKYLCFLDNHCVIGRDYFRRIKLDFETYPMDSLHSVTIYQPQGQESYEYVLSLQKNFWTSECKIYPVIPHKPYRIAVAGHGGFAIRREVFEEVGGYWDGFVGYAGEESYLDLKLAMLNKTNWLDPYLKHFHYAGRRGYPRHFSDDYYRNMMMCANIIGGSEWLNKVADSFTKTLRLKSDATMFDLYTQAEEWSREYAAQFAVRRLRSLDEQLVLFREQDVSC